MEENSYKENLLETSSVDDNRGNDSNASSHRASGECGGTLEAKRVEIPTELRVFVYSC